MPNELTFPSGDTGRTRTRRLLVVALGASAAAHAALLGLVPGFNQEPPAPVRLSALEVVMRVPAESLPPVAEESVPHTAQVVRGRPATQKNSRQREIAAAAAQPVSRTDSLAALPGPSDFQADSNRSPVAASERSLAPITAPPAEKAVAAETSAAPAVASAAYLDNPAPRYPETARRMGQEGTVMLRVLVTADGVAARVALERSSGSTHLDGAALERVRNWRFRPARQGSAPVESWVIVPIVFRLESAS